MSRTRKISTILACVVSIWILTTGCSLHYHQQADSQTLDIEVMRPTSAAGNANQTKAVP